MKTQARYDDGASVTIVSRVVDILEIERGVYPPPNVQGVVCLYDIFATIVELPVPQYESIAT
jgi:hypothetical protein